MTIRPTPAPLHFQLTFQAYLNIAVPHHRVAVTKFMVSDHSLAIEKLRYATPAVRRERKLCPGREEDSVVLELFEAVRVKGVRSIHSRHRCM